MAQRAQVVDITKSYLPGDPNSYVQSLVNTDREDGEEKTMPLMAYEGYNFLPTAYGYKSYFGDNTILDIDPLSSNTQFILSYQLANYQTRLIALCEDGIWMCDANTASAAWTHPVVFNLNSPAPFYTVGVFEEWTWCVIENVLYMYQQGRASAWKTSESGGVLSIVTHTPTFLTMPGQMGIFKAGLRLGFWDSANSVSWSSNLDLTDFTPSIENLAGNTIFGDIIGRIVTIRSHGEGYIVYTTRAVVGVTFNISGNMLWDAKKIFDNIGISYSRAVTYGQNDAEHFIYSTNGIYLIGKYNTLAGKHEVTPLVPEVFDFLKESRDPIYLDTINSRYVFFHILNPDYVYGLTSFTYVSPPDLNVQFQIGGHPWDGQDLPAINIDGNAAAEAIRQLVTFGFTSTSDTTALWNIVTSETQDGTTGPLHNGIGSRNAQTPGFTVTDIQNTYMSGTTLPGELDVDILEHNNPAEVHLGNIPVGAVTITNAMSTSVNQVLQKQIQDWDLFKQHQTAAMYIIASASKTVTTPGSTIVGYTSVNVPTLPSLPATTVVDTVIGDFKTGEGNFEIQLDKPLRKIVMRKYFQESYHIVKRVTTSYVNRAGTPVNGLETTIGAQTLTWVNQGTTLNPTTVNSTAIGVLTYPHTDGSGHQTAVALAFKNGVTPTTVEEVYDHSHWPISGATTSAYQLNAIYGPYSTYRLNGDWSATYAQVKTVTPYYQDAVAVTTYVITGPFTMDMGSVDCYATQIAYGKTIINVTSDPATIVVHSLTPIFPTGVSAISFFPPTWNGTETLKLIAASALSPWHLVDGTFGIELIGDPLAGAETQVDGGGLVVYGEGSIPDDYGVTYSSFPYVLQVGSPFVYYPTFAGALVLDLLYKKWGKMKNDYQILLGLDPINQFNPTILTADDTGMNAALQLVDETIKIFDESPDDSIIRYGKIGFYRLGMTKVLETKLQMRKACTGSLMVDSSMDGRTIDVSLRYTLNYTSARIVEGYPDISARWHVVTISGNYDLTGLEVRATIVSRR